MEQVARGGPSLVDQLASDVKAIFHCGSASASSGGISSGQGAVFMFRVSDETVNVSLVAVKSFDAMGLGPGAGPGVGAEVPDITKSKVSKKEKGNAPKHSKSMLNSVGPDSQTDLQRQRVLETWLEVNVHYITPSMQLTTVLAVRRRLAFRAIHWDWRTSWRK